MVVLAFEGHWLAVGVAVAVLTLLGGGMYNPSIALVAYTQGKLPLHESGARMAAQWLGALAGGFVWTKCNPSSA